MRIIEVCMPKKLNDGTFYFLACEGIAETSASFFMFDTNSC